MNKKQIVRCVIFMVLVVLLVGGLCRLFKYKNNTNSERFVTLRNLQKNEMDILYVGSSAVDRYWNSAQAFNEYGLTGYPVAADGMLAWATKYAIEEALTYQQPELLIVDVRSFTIGIRKDSFNTMAMFTSPLPFYSLPRWKTVAKTEQVMRENEESDFDSLFDINYYLSIGQFHNKWEDPDFSLSEFKEIPSETLGFYVTRNSVKTLSKPLAEELDAYIPSKDFVPLVPVIEDSFKELLDYLKNKPFQVLFIDSPHLMNEETSGRVNTIMKMAEDAGFDSLVVVGKEMGEYSLDPYTEYYNQKHVNYKGAVKYTRYLSEYLKEHYPFLEDHRGEENMSDFKGVQQHIENEVKREEKLKEERKKAKAEADKK